MTGTKDVLVDKLAELAARKYEQKLPEMEAFFTKHRFVRISQATSSAKHFPLLETVTYLQSLLLTMYIMKHLRGNAIIEPAQPIEHENVRGPEYYQH